MEYRYVFSLQGDMSPTTTTCSMRYAFRQFTYICSSLIQAYFCWKGTLNSNQATYICISACIQLIGQLSFSSEVTYIMVLSVCKSEDITYDVAPTPQHPVQHENGQIQCEVSGQPIPTVSWRYRGRRIHTGVYIFIFSHNFWLLFRRTKCAH